MTSENFIKDTYGSFKMEILNDEMTWKRNEDGDAVIVKLKRITKTPKSNRDEILGIWKLESNSGNKSQYIKNSKGEEFEKYLFLKWDRKFVVGLNKGRIPGIYSIHGHKPQIELIPYSDEFIK